MYVCVCMCVCVCVCVSGLGCPDLNCDLSMIMGLHVKVAMICYHGSRLLVSPWIVYNEPLHNSPRMTDLDETEPSLWRIKVNLIHELGLDGPVHDVIDRACEELQPKGVKDGTLEERAVACQNEIHDSDVDRNSSVPRLVKIAGELRYKLGLQEGSTAYVVNAAYDKLEIEDCDSKLNVMGKARRCYEKIHGLDAVCDAKVSTGRGRANWNKLKEWMKIWAADKKIAIEEKKRVAIKNQIAAREKREEELADSYWRG